ncbi:MAG: hypothetical protein WBQ78_01085 [Gammaproteobacteria bacterium]
MNIKPRSLLAAVVALSLAVPGMASADRRGDGYRDQGDRHGYKQSHGYKKQYRDRHYDRHDRGGRHYDRHEYRDRHITHYYKQDDDDGEKLLIGLLVGGVLGYAINGAQHSSSYVDSDRYAPRAQPEAYPADSYAYSDSTCLQEREYQTTVVVGGKNVPAYGTACLQPDGSWKRDRAQLVSY